jgi:Fic family protein
MTNRDFFNAVISANISDEITAFAKASLDKLDLKNEKRRNSTSPNQKKNEDFKADIFADFSAEPNRVFTAKEIADKYGVSTQKISALLRQMVDNGKIKSFDIKDSKKNKVKGYQVI